MKPVLTLLALCCFVSACGSDDDHESAGSSALGTCGLQADVGGDVSLKFTGDDDVACATQHSFDSGLEVTFLGTSVAGSLELQINDVTEGETGADFVTRVMVTDSDQGRFQANDCLTTLSEHLLLKTEASNIGELRHHQVSGDGTCASPLVSASGTPAEAEVDTFAFRAQFTWRD